MQCGMMRLSRYDLKFLQNLMTMTNQNKSLTTNQIELFEKLVKKYNRQLLKHGLNSVKLSTLLWETSIIASDSQFTEAYITIDQDTIIFRSPFNKKFLNKFSKIEINTFKWSKEEKIYKSPYSAYALKFLLNIANEFYPKLNFCKVTAEKIDDFNKYSAGYWNPTLVKVNDYYLIAATNQYIDNALKNITLSSDPKCMSLLTWYGINIDSKIVNDDPLLDFSSKYKVEVDIKNIKLFVNYLKHIGCNHVTVYGPGASNIREKLKKENNDLNVDIHLFTNQSVEVKDSILVITRTLPVEGSPIIYQGDWIKIVSLKNSLAIERL